MGLLTLSVLLTSQIIVIEKKKQKPCKYVDVIHYHFCGKLSMKDQNYYGDFDVLFLYVYDHSWLCLNYSSLFQKQATV